MYPNLAKVLGMEATMTRKDLLLFLGLVAIGVTAYVLVRIGDALVYTGGKP